MSPRFNVLVFPMATPDRDAVERLAQALRPFGAMPPHTLLRQSHGEAREEPWGATLEIFRACDELATVDFGDRRVSGAEVASLSIDGSDAMTVSFPCSFINDDEDEQRIIHLISSWAKVGVEIRAGYEVDDCADVRGGIDPRVAWVSHPSAAPGGA